MRSQAKTDTAIAPRAQSALMVSAAAAPVFKAGKPRYSRLELPSRGDTFPKQSSFNPAFSALCAFSRATRAVLAQLGLNGAYKLPRAQSALMVLSSAPPPSI